MTTKPGTTYAGEMATLEPAVRPGGVPERPSTPPRRGFLRFLDRAILGIVMSVAAFVVERAVVRSMRRADRRGAER